MENEKIREAYYEGYEDACDMFADKGFDADSWAEREEAWNTSDAKKNLQPEDSADPAYRGECGMRLDKGHCPIPFDNASELSVGALEMKKLIERKLKDARRKLEHAKKSDDFARCLRLDGMIEMLENLFYHQHLLQQQDSADCPNCENYRKNKDPQLRN